MFSGVLTTNEESTGMSLKDPESSKCSISNTGEICACSRCHILYSILFKYGQNGWFLGQVWKWVNRMKNYVSRPNLENCLYSIEATISAQCPWVIVKIFALMISLVSFWKKMGDDFGKKLAHKVYLIIILCTLLRPYFQSSTLESWSQYLSWWYLKRSFGVKN